jgi:hypothetical protein
MDKNYNDNYYENKTENNENNNSSIRLGSYSLKQQISKQYRTDLKNKLEKEKSSNLEIDFYKRENILVDILENLNKSDKKSDETGKILNGFLFELQKLLGVNNPVNLFENLDNIDNEKFVNKLQKLYKIVNHKSIIE